MMFAVGLAGVVSASPCFAQASAQARMAAVEEAEPSLEALMREAEGRGYQAGLMGAMEAGRVLDCALFTDLADDAAIVAYSARRQVELSGPAPVARGSASARARAEDAGGAANEHEVLVLGLFVRLEGLRRSACRD